MAKIQILDVELSDDIEHIITNSLEVCEDVNQEDIERVLHVTRTQQAQKTKSATVQKKFLTQINKVIIESMLQKTAEDSQFEIPQQTLLEMAKEASDNIHAICSSIRYLLKAEYGNSHLFQRRVDGAAISYRLIPFQTESEGE